MATNIQVAIYTDNRPSDGSPAREVASEVEYQRIVSPMNHCSSAITSVIGEHIKICTTHRHIAINLCIASHIQWNKRVARADANPTADRRQDYVTVTGVVEIERAIHVGVA